MDVVYLVRPGERNEELRFSLRSLANLPHDRVWVIGYGPPWLVNATVFSIPTGPDRFANTTEALRVACDLPGISDRFYWFTDDVFVVHPTASIPVVHRGPVIDHLAAAQDSEHKTGLTATLQLLERFGIPDPVSYDVHWPLPVDKKAMTIALDLNPGIFAFHKRTFYGNYWGIGGSRVDDDKISVDVDREPDPDALVWSTMDYAFTHGRAGEVIRERFCEPSPYELVIQSEYSYIDRTGRR